MIQKIKDQIVEQTGQIEELPEQEDEEYGELAEKLEDDRAGGVAVSKKLDQEMDYDAIEFEERYGTLRPSALHAQSLGIMPPEGWCEISARFQRIKNEPENYIEDRKICF